jgi:hypothetical protein
VTGRARAGRILAGVLVGGLALLIAGCQTKPAPPSQSSQQQAERTVWRIAERPINDLNFMESCWGRNCLFRASGVWKPSTGKPGSEISEPVSVDISCDKVARQCMEIDASVNPIGFLDSTEMEFHVSSWSEDQIVATTVAGLCEVGRQLVIDLPRKTTILRIYPTKEPSSKPNDPCAIFSDRNSYVLHGGHWQLQPMAPRVIE